MEYINVERASCLGNKGIRNIIKDIVEYIDVEGASSLGYSVMKLVNGTHTKYRGCYHYADHILSESMSRNLGQIVGVYSVNIFLIFI